MLAVPQLVRPLQTREVMDFWAPGYVSPCPTAMKIWTSLQVAARAAWAKENRARMGSMVRDSACWI